MLRFLTAHGFAHIARAARLVRVRGRAHGRDARRRAGVRRRRDRRLGAGARRACASDAGALLDRAARARRGHRRDAHARSARDATDPDFAPEEPERRGARRCSPRRSTRRSSGSSSTCPTTRGARADRGRGEEVRDRLQLLVARRRRRAADPPPRRLPPRPDAAAPARRLGDPRLRGRARAVAARAAPQALAAARRRRACCARSPTPRARRELLRGVAGAGGLGGARARARSSTATSRPSTARCCPPGQPAIEQAAGDLRAREGRLRAALRAQQPPRLGAHPGRRDRPAAGGTADRHERRRPS